VANHSRPDVVFQPRTGAKLQRGIDQLAELLRPTIGPGLRHVAVAPVSGNRAPELLDNGGVIARRMLGLGDRGEDVGAMFLRSLLWRVEEESGDGTATTAILFKAVFDGGLHYLAAGGNAMRLREFLLEGQRLILASLREQARPISTSSQLADVAETSHSDRALAAELGELLFVLGPHGQIETRPGRSRTIESDVLDGAFWESPLLSKLMLFDEEERRVDLEQSRIFVSDLEIEDPRELAVVLGAAMQSGARSLLIVADKLSEQCIALLLRNREARGFTSIAVRLPESAPADRIAVLEDLEILTGARALRKDAGNTLKTFTPDDLGGARRVWADRTYFGVIGGKGDPRRLRRHVRALEQAHLASDDRQDREMLSRRIAKLTGASGILHDTDAKRLEIDDRNALVQRSSTLLRGALDSGVVPGGGIALLRLRERLNERRDAAVDPDERAAFSILGKAVEAPFRAIVANAGYDPGQALARIERAGPSAGWDANSGTIVDPEEAGLLDSAAVLGAAIRAGIEGAAQALTIDTIVHHRAPEEAINP
jgi:chaperonin GroEL